MHAVIITDTLAHNPCMHRVKTAIILLADDAKECCWKSDLPCDMVDTFVRYTGDRGKDRQRQANMCQRP
jgi:hypothetical protein